ncbi:hypothetical protein Fcan01_16591 [Folsomia candida]|uniref:Uncharacterized protein n=1 Tax=Folsomia candida TaxID=158441 RepID=A0A226DV76_FOLCA|nr:hypothetical protein Fcan01_16591 [Folsomia candida]
MKRILGKFNMIDAHFIAVIWILFMYESAVAVMFSIVPAKPQYFYSLLSPSPGNRIDVGFLICLIFEIYANTSISELSATFMINWNATLLSGFTASRADAPARIARWVTSLGKDAALKRAASAGRFFFIGSGTRGRRCILWNVYAD